MNIKKDTNDCCRVVKNMGPEEMIKESTFGDYDKDLLSSARHGDPEAQVKLAELYEDDSEFEKARHWLKLALKKGSIEALAGLANLSLMGPKVLHHAGNPVEWYNKLLNQAIADGNEYYRNDALEHLGHCYEHGLGCEKDLDKALEYYVLGAESDALMCNECAGNILFKKGRYEEAMKYFLKEDSLFPLSSFRLGEMYENGKGTDVDLHQAKICYARVRHSEGDTELGRQADAKLRQAKFFRVHLKPSEDCDYVPMFRAFYTCTDEAVQRYPLTTEAFFRYLANDFAFDLSNHFQVSHDFSPQKLKALNCYERPGNGRRDQACLRFPTHAMFFTVALFYMTLLPQAIGVVCGEKAMFHAYKVSGAPLIFSGLHGLSSPILVLSDVGLLCEPDSQECQQLFEMVHPMMRQLLYSYLFDKRRPTLYPESLKALQEAAAPHADEIWQVCDQHLGDLKCYLADCQVGYPMKLYDDSRSGF